jgi:hypothetical protein
LRDPDIDVVHLAIACGRSKANQVLTVQLVGYASECGAEISIPVLTVSNGLSAQIAEGTLWQFSADYAARGPCRSVLAYSRIEF